MRNNFIKCVVDHMNKILLRKSFIIKTINNCLKNIAEVEPVKAF
ncbi:transposase [Arenibacter nanhaiticus]